MLEIFSAEREGNFCVALVAGPTQMPLEDVNCFAFFCVDLAPKLDAWAILLLRVLDLS